MEIPQAEFAKQTVYQFFKFRCLNISDCCSIVCDYCPNWCYDNCISVLFYMYYILQKPIALNLVIQDNEQIAIKQQMSKYNFSVSPLKSKQFQDSISSFNRPSDPKQNYPERDKYNNLTGLGDSGKNYKHSYKYAYYRDPNEYQYHSKQNIPIDSLRVYQRKSQANQSIQQIADRSPSFRGKSPLHIQSIDEIIQSNRSIRSRHSSGVHQNQFQIQSQQILFLKQKLIQTHNKLLKQLEQKHRLNAQLQTSQAQLQCQRKQNKQIIQQNIQLKAQIQRLHCQLDKQLNRNEQKYHTAEIKLMQQNKRNNQLKDDLQTMRIRMLQTLKAKNNFQQQISQLKNQLSSNQSQLNKLRNSTQQNHIMVEKYLNQIQIWRKKYNLCEQQCEHRAQQIHQYNHLAQQRERQIIVLQQQLKIEQQNNRKTFADLSNLQILNKSMEKKLQQKQQLYLKCQDQMNWAQNNKENSIKSLRQQVDKLTQQLNNMNLKYRQKQKQIDILKRKPYEETQKKRKNYENTKQFINRLQNEQSQLGHSRNTPRVQNKSSKSAGLSPRPANAHNNSVTVRNNSKSPMSKGNNVENPITHKPISYVNNTNNVNTAYQQQKSKYMGVLTQVGELQNKLLSCNQQRRQMMNEMDKIDGTKVKTKDMINKRRKLEQDIVQKQQQIKKVKNQIKVIKEY